VITFFVIGIICWVVGFILWKQEFNWSGSTGLYGGDAKPIHYFTATLGWIGSICMFIGTCIGVYRLALYLVS
jgi:hypothetical protein